jgi:hypothetical protein
MDRRGWDSGRTSPEGALARVPCSAWGEVSLIDRPLTEEEETVNGAFRRGQGLEEEHPGSGYVKASILKRVLGGFVHQPESADLALWALFPLLGQGKSFPADVASHFYFLKTLFQFFFSHGQPPFKR